MKIYVFSNEDEKNQISAIRKRLDDSFDKKRIETITDTGIQQILLRHLEANGGNPKDAFSPEGIERLNDNITELNNGKPHLPIYSVRVTEPLGNKFAIGIIGNKSRKFVEAAKGTNLFFAIYQQEDGKRVFCSLPLNEVVERQKQGLPSAPEEDEAGNKLLFVLSPGDLVYIPTIDERANKVDNATIDKERIYKMVSCTGNRASFIPYFVASPIVDKYEFDKLNKIENVDGTSIKNVCIPIEVDRLGRYKIK